MGNFDFELGHVSFEESVIGKMQRSISEQSENQIEELKALRDDFDKYRADQAADKISDDEQRKRERRSDRIFSIAAGALSGLITSSLAGLLVYYWPVIVSLFNH